MHRDHKNTPRHVCFATVMITLANRALTVSDLLRKELAEAICPHSHFWRQETGSQANMRLFRSSIFFILVLINLHVVLADPATTTVWATSSEAQSSSEIESSTEQQTSTEAITSTNAVTTEAQTSTEGLTSSIFFTSSNAITTEAQTSTNAVTTEPQTTSNAYTSEVQTSTVAAITTEAGSTSEFQTSTQQASSTVIQSSSAYQTSTNAITTEAETSIEAETIQYSTVVETTTAIPNTIPVSISSFNWCNDLYISAPTTSSIGVTWTISPTIDGYDPMSNYNGSIVTLPKSSFTPGTFTFSIVQQGQPGSQGSSNVQITEYSGYSFDLNGLGPNQAQAQIDNFANITIFFDSCQPSFSDQEWQQGSSATSPQTTIITPNSLAVGVGFGFSEKNTKCQTDV